MPITKQIATSLPEIVTTGASGLVGSRVIEVLNNRYHFVNLDLHNQPPVDITDYKAVLQAISQTSAQWVVHFAAFTDVNRAHLENGDKSGLAYRINVEGTKSVVAACEQLHKKLIHISTAYVFDGTKQTPYVETDQRNPIEWYGTTKALAEEVVENSPIQWAIVRIDNPFRTSAFPKLDLVRRLVDKIRTQTLPPQFIDSQFGPTLIEDTAEVIAWIIASNQHGYFHATNNESWSPYDFAQAVAARLHLEDAVKPGSLKEYLRTSSRPYQANTSLDCTKLISESGLQLHTIAQALDQVSGL